MATRAQRTKARRPRCTASQDDALELRCALRVALGVDVSAGDVDRLIGQIDNDGNGVLNFDEFMGICQDKSA